MVKRSGLGSGAAEWSSVQDFYFASTAFFAFSSSTSLARRGLLLTPLPFNTVVKASWSLAWQYRFECEPQEVQPLRLRCCDAGFTQRCNQRGGSFIGHFLGFPQHQLLVWAADLDIIKAIEVSEDSFHCPDISQCPVSPWKE